MSVGDTITGLQFMAELSNCPTVYRQEIGKLLKAWNSEVRTTEYVLTQELVEKSQEFFRKESFKYIKSNSDTSKFASGFMMFLVALSDAVHHRNKTDKKY